MFFWIREILGWSLVIIALALLWVGVDYASDPKVPRIGEAGLCIFGALSVMKMGVLLVRISTAAKICQNEAPPSP